VNVDPSSAAIAVHWHTHSDAIDAAIWQRCFRPGQQGLFWYQSLERADLKEQFAFFYGLVTQGEKVLAIAPAFVFDVPMDLVAPPAVAVAINFVARGPLRRLAYQRTFFIGNVAGEEGLLGLAPGTQLEGIALLVHDAARAKAKQLRAPMLVWKDFGGGDAAALAQLAAQRTAFAMVSYPGTAMPLLAGGFAAFLGSQKAARRHQMQKKLRRGDAAGPAVAQVLRQPDGAVLAECFALFEQTYAKASTRFERLNLAYFEAIAAYDEAVFVVLRSAGTGRAEAFMLLLNLGPRIINQFIGIDYALGSERFLYFRLFAAAYDWASTTGASSMHSGQTGYRAKLDLGHQLVPLMNVAEHQNALVNRLYAWIVRGVSWRTLDADLALYLNAHPQAEVPAAGLP
jgi:uncharacterized protein